MCLKDDDKKVTVTPLRFPLVTLLLLLVLLLLLLPVNATSVHGEGSGRDVGGGAAARNDYDAWRSAEALHPIQTEMMPYVREMIRHAFDSYIKYAFPKDELCPVSGTGKNTMGGYGWTLIDALDTLAVAGFHTEFRRYAKWVEENVNFDIDATVSAFESTIRTLGGLLAAHFMYEEGVVKIVPEEHNYTGGLLRLAADLGDRLLPCFNTTTGIPYGSFNLRHGVHPTETILSSVAGSGTCLMEMTALSRVTGDVRYEQAARRASEALFNARSPVTGLMGNHIDIRNKHWFLTGSHLSGWIDSAVEYFIKAHTMTGNIDDWERFERYLRDVNRYIRKGGMLTTVSMYDGRRLSNTHESLSSFFPGNLVVGGHHAEAIESNWPIHSIFRHFGALPETSYLDREGHMHGYPQRPEHAESLYMLYRATRDPAYLVMGRELVVAINLRMRAPYGFSTLHSVNFPHEDYQHGDTMESFMLAETLKYLYLLFDECNVIHVQGRIRGGVPPYCAAVESGSSVGSHVGWVFNTEAHLFPSTAEWWVPVSAGGAGHGPEKKADDVPVLFPEDGQLGCHYSLNDDTDGPELHRRRLAVIDGLIESLEELQSDGERAGNGNTVPHQFYCSNHAMSDVERISKSIFR